MMKTNIALPKSARRSFFLAVALFLSALPAYAQSSQAFERIEAMIPARDGVKLHTVILAPRQATGPLPILMVRTPYGVSGWTSERVGQAYRELAADGYIFAFQDIRGRFKSEGQFVMVRPPRDKNDPKSIDESSDTYDTIEWLVKNVRRNNGRVGIFGVSYPGWLAAVALLEPHPALKASSPQAQMGDVWMGDDFFHQGAFRLSYGYEYVTGMETTKDGYQPQFDTRDTYEWYLKQGALSNITAQHVKGKLPTWNDFVAHPNYDGFWQRRAAANYLKEVTVPTLHVAGWWDQEDFYGPIKSYLELEKRDSRNLNYLVVGPWNHGGWNGGGERLGKIEFGSATGRHFRERIQAPWFAYHLKGQGTLGFPEAQSFQSGANRWVAYSHWPPVKQTTERRLYFHPNGKLSFDAPAQEGDGEFDRYVSDPADPVPYRPRPIEATYSSGSRWGAWLAEDQRFVHRRPDVLSWMSEPLKEDLVVSGEILAHLFASTSGTDSDWVVKLIDVYPEDYPERAEMAGYQFMVAGEVMRGRFHRSFERPEPLVPNQVTEFKVNLLSKDHRFLTGHRLMVQVQSTWFPVIDRNPQKFVENIFKAQDSDFQAATQRVFRSRRFPSHLRLPVAAGSNAASRK